MTDQRSLHAPHLIDTEVLSAIRRWAHEDRLSQERAAVAVTDLADMPITRYPHAPLSPRVWALRESFGAYDATYVALAEALAAPLLTSDARLGRGSAPLVEVIVPLEQ